MRARSVWYVYPFWQRVSFGAIGERHYYLLKQYLKVESIDELAFPFIQILSYPLVLLQPFFYPFQKFEKKLARNLTKIKGLIGIDVADSDHITEYAVKLTEYATALIVPSELARKAYVNSGVKRPVHILPHGVDREWIEAPKQPSTTFAHLAHLKKERNLKLILCWILHSPYRKGLDLLLQFYQNLLSEYNNVLLVVKTSMGVGYFPETIEKVSGTLEYHLDGFVMKKWLTEQEKMQLFDLCDLYFLASRGGGFEHPPLEALARGEAVLGAKGGSWEDWMPDWALIPSRRCGVVLHNNPIHDGGGVEIDIEKAVDKTLEIFNNPDEYKALIQEHITYVIQQKFLWEKIGLQLRDIVLKYF